MMKKVFYFMSFALIMCLSSTSCKKNDTTSTGDTQDIADEIAASVGSSNSGLSSEIVSTAQLTKDYKSLKSSVIDTLYSVDTMFTKSSTSGAKITYNYSYNVKYGYVFDNNSLNNMYYNSVLNGSYDALRISSTDDRKSSWVVTGLPASSSNYVLNGTTERTGSSQSKVRNKRSFTSGSQITLTDVKVNKSSLLIVSGTLNWSISGTLNGQSYSYSAVLIYQGNGTAQLTLNGTAYTISLSTGEIE
jgi:hypothetical protein